MNEKLTSRVIFRNIPRYFTEAKLKDIVQNRAGVEVTDVRIPKDAHGKSRQIGFIGVRDTAAARSVIDKFDRSFLDTSKISVAPAFPPGSQDLPRPWSRHTPGSTAYEQRLKKKEESKVRRALQKTNLESAGGTESEAGVCRSSIQEDLLRAEFLALTEKRKGEGIWCDAAPVPKRQRKTQKHTLVTVQNVVPTKAGVGTTRKHVRFCSDDEHDSAHSEEERDEDEDTQAMAMERTSDQKAAPASVSKDLSDTGTALDWLRKKSQATLITPETPTVLPQGDITPEKASPDQKKSQEDETDNHTVLDNKDEHASLDQTNDAILGETGRLLILNLPYTATEEDLRQHLSQFGEVAEVHICRDEDGVRSRGRAFACFAFPEHAIKAASALELSIFQGRMLRVVAAHPPKQKLDVAKVVGKKKASSSYKRQFEQQQKQNAANVQTWNLLYVSANAALDAAGAELGVSKSSLLGLNDGDVDSVGVTDESMAARVALSETYIVKQTKQWLKAEGINVACFERQGVALLSSRETDQRSSIPRSSDSIVVKHLPASTTETELQTLFSKSGPLTRCCLAPSKTVAVIQFLHDTDAQKAFKRLAYSRFKNVPLFVEWAPVDVFLTPKPSRVLDYEPITRSDSLATLQEEPLKTDDLLKMVADQEEVDAGHTSLFVKNLNFETTEEALTSKFSTTPGFVRATIMKKMKPMKSTTDAEGQGTMEPKRVSMGYGFLEYTSMAAAREVLKRFQSVVLDGHALELKISERSRPTADKVAVDATAAPIDVSKITNKLAVRNLAFQATKKDLRQLFGAFGNVVAVRVPKKLDGTSRGYGFVEFLSRTEALPALEALQHTHLYGRRMIIEPAEQTDISVEAVRAKQDAAREATAKVSESKRRKIKDTLETAGDTRASLCKILCMVTARAHVGR